jgi:ABC-2 type transport system permease protein
MTSDPAPRLSGAPWRVFELSIGEMLWSRRTIFMALVLAGPVVLAIVARLVQGSGVAPLRVNGAPVGGIGVFGMMIWVLFVRFIVPVLGVFYGTALIADEVDDKTITYLFTRPIPRGAVLIGKYIAYLVCTVLVVLPSVMIVYFLVVPFRDIASTFHLLLVDLGLLALGLAVYGAVFAWCGTVLKRPLVIGLVFAFGWEQIALLMPGYLRHFTVAYYLQGLVPHVMPSDSVITILQAAVSTSPPVSVCLLSLTAIWVVMLWLARRGVERREYVLDQ